MALSPNVKGALRPQTRGNYVDEAVARLAGGQHGVVSRRDLCALGVGAHAIKHRLRCGRLHRVHRGVYAVGHASLTLEGLRMAAVLAAGPGAVLSHRAAAAHLGVLRSEAIEVTLDRRRRPLRRVLIHQLPLRSDEITIERGIPLTTVSRTLFDLAAVLPRAHVERAINEAEVQRLGDSLSLPELVERYPRRRGVAVVKAILEQGIQVTRSELEVRFLSFLGKHRFPRPATNLPLHVAGRWIECDCVWPDRNLIVELDGRASHDTAAAFERDRARDRVLQARGWRLVRITWRQLRDEPEALAYDLRTLLNSAVGAAPSRSTSQLPSRS